MKAVDNYEREFVPIKRISGVTADGWLQVELVDGTVVQVAFADGQKISCKWPEGRAEMARPLFRFDRDVLAADDVALVGIEFVTRKKAV